MQTIKRLKESIDLFRELITKLNTWKNKSKELKLCFKDFY